MIKFICLVFHVDKKIGEVSGLAMMHDLMVHIMKKNGYEVKIVSNNATTISTEAKIGKPKLRRYFEYSLVLLKLFVAFLVNRKVVFYFSPSTAKVGFYRDVIVVAMAKLFGHKVFMQQFGALFESFKNGLSQKESSLLNWTYNKADLIVVEGEYAREQYSFIKDQSKIRVIQNGLPELNSNIQKAPKIYSKNSPFNLFYMNNMIESKGYVDVLKAVDILINRRKRDVTCSFAGGYKLTEQDEYFKSTSEAQQWFETFINEKGLTGKVSYHKGVFDEEKISEFRKSHVFLLPSYYFYEGQPTAILEALSYGSVPIVTRYRLIPDMVNDECGIFVEPKSPESIADAVENLMDNPELYGKMSKNACDRFQKNFTQDAYANKVLEAIKTL